MVEDRIPEGGQISQHILAELRCGGGRHAGRSTEPDGVGQVGRVHIIPMLGEHPQTHHVEPELECALFLHLQQPSGGNPCIRAHGVEIEVHDGRLTSHGYLTIASSSSTRLVLIYFVHRTIARGFVDA